MLTSCWKRISFGTIDSARIGPICVQQGLCICRASVCPSVCRLLSVCPFRPPHAAAGLLLWARRPGDIDRLLHGKGPAASSSHIAASNATLSAGVRSWTPTCLNLIDSCRLQMFQCWFIFCVVTVLAWLAVCFWQGIHDGAKNCRPNS